MLWVLTFYLLPPTVAFASTWAVRNIIGERSHIATLTAVLGFLYWMIATTMLIVWLLTGARP